MKSTIRKTVTALGVFFIFLSLGTSKVQAYPDRGITLQTFYDELSYYGDWIYNPDYGYVWRPNVGRDFRPYYTNGRWAMTEYGNTWVSDYEWGWAPFHYGRWFYDDYDGWVWLPDTVWGPSWVSWRSGGGYYGWAPLGPRISININFGRNYRVPNNHWVFIPQRCIYYPSYGRYWEPRRNVYIINNTTIINNIYTSNRNVRYFTGPRADEIRRVTRQNVPVYRITDDDRPGSTRVDRGNVRIYRPEIKGDSRDAAPRTIASNNSARPSRSNDNGVNRGGSVSNPSNGTSRPQRPDAIANPRTTDNVGNDRGSIDNRSQRSDANPSSTDRPTRSSSPSVDRGNAPVRQEPSRGDSDNRTIQRPDAPTRVERPTPSPREQAPSSNNGSNSRPERSQPSQPAPRQESRTQSAPAPRQETRSESRPQRSEPAPRQQETKRAEPQRESSSSRSESSSGRPSARPGNRGN